MDRCNIRMVQSGKKPGLPLEARQAIRAGIRAEWVGASALARLEDLGLPEEAEEKVLGWIVDGTLAAPSRDRASSLVRAALELVLPTAPATAADLARLAAELYGHHPRMMRRELGSTASTGAARKGPRDSRSTRRLAARRPTAPMIVTTINSTRTPTGQGARGCLSGA